MRDQQPAFYLPTPPAPHPAPREPFGTAEETAKWKKVSYVFIGGVVIPFTTFSVIKHFAHHQCRSTGRRSGRPHGSGQTHQHWHFARRSVSRNRPSLPPGGHILNPHTPHPKPTMFPLHSQRCGGEARFPLRHQARQAHAVDAQGRVQVRSVRLRVRREGEGRPQGYSGGVERQNQTRHFSREDRGVGVQPLAPILFTLVTE